MRSLPLWAALTVGCLYPAIPLVGDVKAYARPSSSGGTTRSHHHLHADEVRVADLARLAPGAHATLGQLVVLRLPAGRTTALSEEQRRTLLRRRVPGRGLALRESGTVRFVTPALPSPSPAGCGVLASPLDQGAYLDYGAVTDTPCRAEAPLPALRHDPRAGAPYATAPLPTGTYLGRLALRAGPVVASGAQMRLVSAAGPVVIERVVSTLQPARAGQRVFAAGNDGTIVASRLLREERQ